MSGAGMRVAYGSRGLIGTLTPQANTTVEPEFAILLPPGIASINARMTSDAAAMPARLVEYFGRLDEWIGQFANAPLNAIAIACTGASYLVGLARERALVDAAAIRAGVPVITSGLAVAAAFTALDARRVALVSPYPRALTDASVAYWQSHGVAVARVVEVGAAGPGSFHPIYAVAAADAAAALDTLNGETDIDVVVMLGTGMPTLQPILDHPRVADAPVISCMLATAWRTMLTVHRDTPSREGLLAWIDQPEWRGRFKDAMCF